MAHAVLISIRPEWCDLIASGHKTLEIRKSRPSHSAPFKCYIYCTSSRHYTFSGKAKPSPGVIPGKIIGEFICSWILPISIKYSDPNSPIAQHKYPYTAMTDKEIIDYLGNGVMGQAWHITELKIYKEPKELSVFGLRRPPQSWRYVDDALLRRQK